MYRIIRSLKILDIFDIITRGQCLDYRQNFISEIESIKGRFYLDNKIQDIFTTRPFQLDILSVYISDYGLTLYTSKVESIRLKKLFSSWNIFINVNSWWYGGDDTYCVSFTYNYESFEKLYKEWERDRRISEIIKN